MRTNNIRSIHLLLLLVILHGAFWCAAMSTPYLYFHDGIIVTSAPVFLVPFTYLIGDLTAEIYGYKTARLIVFYNLIGLFIFCLSLYLLSSLSKPISGHHQLYNSAYKLLFSPELRVYFSNLVAIAVGAFLNIYFLSKWKTLLSGRFFLLRSIGASLIGEVVFSALVNIAVNYGLVSLFVLIKMILASYVLKLIITTIFSFPNALIASWIKRHFKMAIHQDLDDLNPFALHVVDTNVPK